MLKVISSSFGRQLTVALVQLLIVIYISREFGAEGSGVYALSLLLPTMLNVFLNLGVPQTNVYFLNQKKFTSEEVAGSTIFYSILLSVIGILFSLIVVAYSDFFFQGVDKEYLYISMLSFPFILSQSFLSSLFQAREDFFSYNTTLLIQPVLLLILVLLFFILDKSELLFVFYSFLFSHIVAFLYALCIICRIEGFKLKKNLKYNRFYLSELRDYGLKSHVTNVISFLNYRVDMYIVGFFLSPTAVGVYIISVQLAEKYWMISQAISTVLYPRLSSRELDFSEKGKITTIFFKLSIILTFLAVLVTMPILAFLIPFVFGEEFSDSFYILLILIPGVLFMSGSRIIANDIAARGRADVNMYGSILVVVLNVLGSIAFVPRYGLVGAATTTSVCYMLNLLYRLLCFKFISGVSFANCFSLIKSDFKYIRGIR